jgi:hypothetical protein
MVWLPSLDGRPAAAVREVDDRAAFVHEPLARLQRLLLVEQGFHELLNLAPLLTRRLGGDQAVLTLARFHEPSASRRIRPAFSARRTAVSLTPSCRASSRLLAVRSIQESGSQVVSR